MDVVNMQTENPRRYKALLQVTCVGSTLRCARFPYLLLRRRTLTISFIFAIRMANRELMLCSVPRSLQASYSGFCSCRVRTQPLILEDFDFCFRSFRPHHIVFLHGVTQRALRCSLANLSVNWFESEPNPPNGSVLIMRRNSRRDSGQRWSEHW